MPNPIKIVAIVGSGQMGCGIAHTAALAGFDVLLSDISAERIEKGIATISGNMAYACAGIWTRCSCACVATVEN